MKKTVFALLIWQIAAFSLVLDLPLDQIRYEIKRVDDFDRVFLYNGSGMERPAAPETPVMVFSFGLPIGQRICEVRVLESTYQDLPGTYNLYPEQRSQSLTEPPSFTEPDPLIYGSEAPYPGSPLVNYHSGNLRGYSMGQVSLCPFQYHPRTGRLKVLKKIRIDVRTAVRPAGIAPLRQSEVSRLAFKKLVDCVAIGPLSQPFSRVEDNPEDLAATLLPSTSGPPVDLIIVTTENKYGAYEKFARIKKMFGFYTVLKTMTWVRSNYSGMDDAERLRNFLRDAVVNWGTSYVLLGADVPEIPTRIVRMEPLIGPWPTHIATDLYYSDLDGNWNFDGDTEYGEIDDSLDLYPDILVGRITAAADSDVVAYQDKLMGYLFPQGLTGFNRVLFVSSDWWSDGDARAASSRIAQHLPAGFDTSFIDEPLLPEFKDSLYSSWGVIGVLAHGDVNLLRIHSTYPRTFATSFFFDSLTPTDIIHPPMFVITCYTNPYEVDALGEHWVNNHDAGGIAYIGPSYSSSAGDHEAYTTVLVDSMFSLPLAAALAYSKVYWIPQSIYWDNWKRSFQFSQTLLGDPTIYVWDTIPRDLSPVNTDHDTLDLGFDTLTISLAYRIGFSVVFYKPDEIFLRDSGCGSIRIPLKTRSSGYLHYMIRAPGFLLHRDSIYVRSTRAHLLTAGYRIVDSLGNHDHLVNPAEDIFLYLQLKNTGSEPARSVWAAIASPDSFLTVIEDSAGFPDIPPGGSAENAAPFHFRTRADLPDGHGLNFLVASACSAGSNCDTFQLVSRAPRIAHYGQSYEWRGDTAGLVIFLKNEGHFQAESLVGLVSRQSDSVTVLDSAVFFPLIPAGGVASSYPDSIRAAVEPGAELSIRLTVYDRGRVVLDQPLRYRVPSATGRLWHEGRKSSIVLRWLPVPGAAGYRIYRTSSPTIPYQFLDNPLEPYGYYEDQNVNPITDYYYFVTTLDSSMNESPASDTITAQTNPRLADGWPVTMRGYAFSSPNFGDIDPDYPGLEVVVGGKDGALYAWHHDGTPVAGDGILLQTDGEIWSSPAIGDVNHDGLQEICTGVRGGTGCRMQVIDGSGLPLPGWPRDIEWGALTSPVLSDVDQDSFLEIFIISEFGNLYAFRYDASPAFHDSCVLKTLYGGTFGTPSVGDINADGRLEIVSQGGVGTDSLFVWDHEGNYLPPFPVAVVGRMKYSTVLGDICGDSDLEICFYTDSTEYLNLVSAQGGVLWQRNFNLGDVEAAPIIANVAGGPRPEIVCGNNLGLVVYDSLGDPLPGFPLYNMEHNWKMPISCDLDEDRVADIVCGSSYWFLFGHRPDGSPVKGFPIPMGNSVECSPAAGDLDEDGLLELMSGDNSYQFRVFDLTSEVFEWPKFRYDQYNTGCYRSGNWHGIRSEFSRPGQILVFFRCAPNPFRDRLKINFDIGKEQSAKGQGLKIFDVTGRLVKSFSLPSALGPMPYALVWGGDDDLGRRVSAGVYFVKFESGGASQIRKVILVR